MGAAVVPVAVAAAALPGRLRAPALAAAARAPVRRHALVGAPLGGAGRLDLEDLRVARDLGAGQGLAGELLDVAEQGGLLGGAEGRGPPARLGAGGAPDPVDVVLGDVGQVEVHHVADLGHVDAAGRDVGGHQHPVGPVLEAVERHAPLPLGAVGVDAGRLVAGPRHAPSRPGRRAAWCG